MDLREIEEKVWANKNVSDFYYNWPLGMKRSEWFAEQLKKHKFNSIFEVGLMGGRNIKVINDYIPNLMLGGLDINKSGVCYTREKIINGKFYHMSAFDIDKLEDNWDIIFTMGTMIHLAPDLIHDFCKKLILKTNYRIFHIEYNGGGKIINGPKELFPTSGKITNKIRWEPDIISIYKNIGIKDIKISTLPTNLKASDMNSIVEIKLK